MVEYWSEATLTCADNQTLTWSVDDLRPNPRNPRGAVDPSTLEELVASIRVQGVLQPLLICPNGIIVAGHRRLAAAKLAGLCQVPVVVRDLTEAEQLEIMLTENLQREDLTPLQEARAYQQLRNLRLGLSEIARKVGVTSSRVQSRLVLLSLDPEVQGLFDAGELPITLAPLLARVSNVDQQRRLARVAALRRLTVSQLGDVVERSLGVQKTQAPRPKGEQRQAYRSTSPSVGRAEAIDLLQREPERSVTYADIGKLFDDVCGICGVCGMSRVEIVCRECPLPKFVARLVE